MMKIQSEKIDLVSTSVLVNHPKNMHSHSDEQIERLCGLIKYQGWRNPIIIQRGTNLVVAGNGRLMAARKMGIEKVPVIEQEFESEAQLYAYMVSDNAIGKDTWATLDLSMVNAEMLDFGPEFDLDMLGLKDFVVEPIEKFEPQGDEDAVPEVEHPITVRGDIWLLGNHRLMCGDSTMIDDVEKLLDNNYIECVYTDPPYGVSIVSKQYGDGKIHGNGVAKRGDFKPIVNDETTDVAREVYQIVKTIKPRIEVIWGANYFTDFLPPSRCWFTWYKKDNLPNDNFADCELAYVNQDKNCKVFCVAWKGMIKEGEYGQKRVHPTQKPILLAEKCFSYLGVKENVLDLFAGSGSTLIACEKNSISSFNMEMDEHYCDVIINRWQNFTGKKATLESTGQTYEELKAVRNATA